MNPKYTIPILQKHLEQADGKLMHILRENEDGTSPIFIVGIVNGNIVHSKYTLFTKEEGLLILDGYEEVERWQCFSICEFIDIDSLRVKMETQKKIQDAQPKPSGIGMLLGQALGHPAEEPPGTKQ